MFVIIGCGFLAVGVFFILRAFVAFATSFAGLFFLAGFLLVAAAGAGVNYVKSLGSGEWLPMLGGMEERMKPFMEFDNLGYAFIEKYDVRIATRVTNNSVYPLSGLRVDCEYSMPGYPEYPSEASFTAENISEANPLLPGKSRIIMGDQFGPSMDSGRLNGECHATLVQDPFRAWSGIPYPYANQNWQEGYRGRSRTR